MREILEHIRDEVLSAAPWVGDEYDVCIVDDAWPIEGLALVFRFFGYDTALALTVIGGHSVRWEICNSLHRGEVSMLRPDAFDVVVGVSTSFLADYLRDKVSVP